MKRLARWTTRTWPWSLCAALCIALFWDVLLAPSDQILGGNDLAHMFRVWLDFARDALWRGELPLWNPYLFSGMPLVSDPQPALFYPPTWLAFVLPSARALGLTAVLHVWWSMVGAAIWLRSETDRDGAPLSRSGAIAGAAVFAFSGYVFARLQAGHIGVVTTGAWLPWGLYALKRLVTRPDWRRVAMGAICVAMAPLAGHSATLIYVGLLWTAYALFLVWQAPASRRHVVLRRMAAVIVLGAALAAVQLLPFASYLLSSTRLGRPDYVFSSRFSWPIGYLLTLLIPNFFGEPVRTGYWGDGVYEEMIYYVGILPLLLIWLVWRARRVGRATASAGFWLTVAAISLFSAFGSYGIVHRLFYRFIPGFSMMRAPARAGVLFTCAAALTTAQGVSMLAGATEDRRRALLGPLLDSSLVWRVPFAATLTTAGCYLVYAFGKDTLPEIGRFWHTASQVAAFGLFFAVAVGYLHRWQRPEPPRWLAGAAAALVILDLWTFGAVLVRTVPAPLSGYWRIVSRYVETDDARILPWGLTYQEHNGAMSYGLRSVFGYNPLENELYTLFTASPDPRARVYDLLNVGYVSSTSALPLAGDDTLSLVAEESGVSVYRRSTALPRVWIATEVAPMETVQMPAAVSGLDYDLLRTALVESDVECPAGPAGSAWLTGEATNSLTAVTEGDGGLAVFSERYAPGWRATVDGVRAPVVRVDGMLRGVCVPAGEHVVELDYRPLSLTVGAALSLTALAAVTFLCLHHRRLCDDA